MRVHIRRLAIATAVCAGMLAASSVVFADNSLTYGINLDGRAITGSTAVISDSGVMIPVREVFEALGFTVTWDDIGKSAVVKRQDFIIRLKAESIETEQNGYDVPLSMKTAFINGKLYADASILTKSIGVDVIRTDRLKTLDIADGALKTKIDIPDKALTNALIAKLELPANSKITLGDALFCTSLDLSSQSIYNVTGLDYFKNLESLNLSNNRITVINDLASLSALKNLNLKDNQVVDIAPLKTIRGLESLDLSNNKVRYLDSLKNLFKLKTLLIAGNPYPKENLNALYFMKTQLIKADFDLQGVDVPIYDTWNLRNDAPDFRIEVQPGIYWVPASHFGNSLYKNEDLGKVLVNNSAEGKRSKITNIYELIQYFQHIAFDLTSGDLTMNDSDRSILWKYTEPAKYCLEGSSGSDAALSNAVAYLLSDDVKESGVVTVLLADGTEVSLNYIYTQYEVTVEPEDKDDDDQIVKKPEYALFDVKDYLWTNATSSAPEDGLIESYKSSAGIKGNIHVSDDLMKLIWARFPKEDVRLVYSIRYRGNSVKMYPIGSFTDGRNQSAKSFIFPNEPTKDDSENIAKEYNVLYNDPNDNVSAKFSENRSHWPTWE